MTHLTPDELIDAMEETIALDRKAHLAACVDCQQQLADLAGVLADARRVNVPEPSPLFWKHLSAKVNAEIDRQIDGAWPAWLRWQWLLPLGTMAIVVLALVVAVPRAPQPRTTEPAGVMPQYTETDNWGALAELVGEFDLDAANEAGVLSPGLADQAVLGLTAEEQAELTRLLKAELPQVKS